MFMNHVAELLEDFQRGKYILLNRALREELFYQIISELDNETRSIFKEQRHCCGNF